MMTELSFESVRSDWYAANTLIPRLLVKAVREGTGLKLVGFPAQWIPVCAHYGIDIVSPTAPSVYLPLFSDIPVAVLEDAAESAKARGASRPMLEAAATLDPVIADLVYIVDHKLSAAGYRDPATTPSARGGVNFLNTWHSFGRPEVIELQEQMCRHGVVGDTAVLLPCSRHRPYHESRTHVRLRQKLTQAGHNVSGYSQIVVTALGVVPEDFWCHPLVMTYDAGAVDLWRVFTLLRSFFQLNGFSRVIDCLSFKPYSEMLNTLCQLGVIKKLSRPLRLRWRGFHINLS